MDLIIREVADSDLDAVLSLNQSEVPHVGSVDLSADFLASVSEGKAAFAIDQQQYLQGYLPVAFLAMNKRFGLIPGGNVPSGPNLITKEKAGQAVDLAAKGIR